MKKDTAGKPKVIYTDPHFLFSIAKVREFGVKKYENEHGWKLMPTSDYAEAAVRHVLKMLDAFRDKDISQLYDEESGLLHSSHAACCLMFIEEAIRHAANTEDVLKEESVWSQEL